MKLSELNIDLEIGQNEIEDLYRELNDTNSDYPREKSIVDLFNEQVEVYPDKVAVTMDDNSITYRLLDQKANRIANFLLQEGVTNETVVGIYLDRSIDLIICIFGVLKASGAYLPLNVEYPEEQCLHMLEKAQATFLIGQKSHIRTLNQLQWECGSLKSIVCVDSEDIHSEKELRNNLMKDLWEYVQDNTDDDIAKGGWMSSYTGKAMSREEMDEYGNNVYKKLSPYVSAEKKVLEVGCSSGLTMYRVAPQVKTYYGTDISKSIIDWNRKQCDEKGISNIKLECVAAEDIHQIDEKDFDIIIFNSVIQVLSGFNSLRDVLRKAVSMLSDKGILFFGDIMDLGLKKELLESLHQFKRENNCDKTKLAFDDELFVPRGFFDDQRFEVSGVKQVTHSNKIHTIKNELTEFRYDTIIEVDKASEPTSGEKNKKQYDLRYILNCSHERPAVEVEATQLSNIMYTSGSTGAPKGVMIQHRSNVRTVVNSFLGVRPEDIWLQTAEVSFDPSCQEIFGALLNGATLCLIEKEKLIDPEKCQAYFKDNSISILQLVTALFHHLGDTHPAMFSQVRKLVVGGDVLSKRIVDKVKKKAENLEIVNAYGPTENCVISTVYTVAGDAAKIPIGKPISNSGVYILDDKGELLPDGMAGELYVFGDGLARGYINDKALTDERFLPNHIAGKGRMYRTGDLARLTSDLNVEFLGRQDSQVKINGKRVELQEIEEVLKEVLQIDQVLVMLYEREGVSFLCAYLVDESEVNEENLKSKLFSKLPDHMIPRFYVTLSELPITTNGKIDKKALTIPDFKNIQIDNFIAPRNKAEMKLAEVFKQVLKIDHVSVDHNFFKIGGHSLLATQVISQINQRFGIELELKTFFSQPTVEKLAVVISGLNQAVVDNIEPVKKAKLYEPSQAQKRLWILEHFEEEKAAYNISDAFLIKGEVDPQAFEDAVNLLIDRYEILRTVFVTDDNGNPMQKVTNDTVSIDFRDLRREEESGILVKRICINESSKHFDLENGPLINFHLFKLDEKEYVLLLVMHHIISDGWSLQLLMDELLKAYHSLSNKEEVKLPSLKIQYKDYAAWHNEKLSGSNIEKHRQYWKGQYEEGIPGTQLQTDYDRPSVKTSFGERKTFELPAEITSLAKQLNSKEEVTMFMFIQTVVNLWLHNHTKSEDIVVGTPVAGRNHPDIENQIGLFLNTLVLKNKITQDKKLKDLLSQVKFNTIGAFDHQVYPFDWLVEDLGVERDISKTPLFNVGFTWQNIDGVVPGTEIVDLDEISISPFGFDYQRVKTDLWFHGWENEDKLQFSLTYNKDLFKEETIEDYIKEFKLIFDRMSKSPEKDVAEILSGVKKDDGRNNHRKKEKRKKKSFKGFLNVEAKPIDFSEKENMVEIGPMNDLKAYPLVIKPKVDGLLLSEWMKTNRDLLIQHLRKTGALLLRGFNTKTEVDFQEAISSLSTESMSYVDQSSPRTKVSNKVYTSTDHPEDQRINMHNELSYSHDWPLIISFFCQTPPASDGETPIADTREVLNHISEKTRDKFIEHGVRYVRNLVNGIGLSWQQVYQTESKEEVEEYCRKNDINFDWISDDHLRISWNRPAIQQHPKTGEKTWFNHGFFFNAYNLDQAIHDITNDKNLLPFNTFFGNGDEITFDEFKELRGAFDKCKVKFEWQKGDILILDNMSMAHGRESYQGQRKILVSMNDPFSKLNILDQV